MKDKDCRVLIFMDACYSGALGNGNKTKDYTGGITSAIAGAIGFLSSTKGQPSAESDKYRHGIFTSALIDGLTGGGCNEEGNITIYKLEDYIKREVQRRSKGNQSAIVKNEEIGDAVLFYKKK